MSNISVSLDARTNIDLAETQAILEGLIHLLALEKSQVSPGDFVIIGSDK